MWGHFATISLLEFKISSGCSNAMWVFSDKQVSQYLAPALYGTDFDLMFNFTSLTLIPISFFPTYSLYHALVTRYLNNMNQILTIFLARGSSDSVAKRITRQTSDREDCSSNPPGGECIYSNVKKLGLSGIRTRISCVEARCPNHITNA